ncbi:MAG: transglycosylase SLT domain-containing protein [Oceanospirillaceae bacterium]|nr:transglycosylase SLT domain-containing protein [Oceanospirillaceae bacterium]
MNVAYKAYQQREANDGKITNWSGLLMAAAPLAGDFGFDKTAEVIADYGDYASPWLGLAEKAINGDEITSDDYIMAVGNTLSAAAGGIGGEGEAKFSLQNITARLGAQLAISGAMYDQLDDKDLAIDYFANAVGQEVGGLTTQALKESRLGQAAESFKAQNIADRQKAQQARNFENTIRDLAVDELARQNPGMTETELKQLKQDMADGTVPTPTIKFMEGQKDADGNKVYGAFDAENNEIRLDKDLYDQAASGDMDATAKLLGVYLEEQGHAVASVMEQRMGVQDFRFDEGGMVARELLKDFSASGGNFGFSLNIAGNTTDFVTSAEAIDNEVATHFTAGRLLSDKQLGSLEFSSTNAAGTVVTIQSGDTLGAIVKAELGAGATAKDIANRINEYKKANAGLNPNKLKVGQELNIPGAIGNALTLEENMAAGGIDLRHPWASFSEDLVNGAMDTLWAGSGVLALEGDNVEAKPLVPDFLQKGQFLSIGDKGESVVDLQKAILEAGSGLNLPEVEALREELSGMEKNSGYYGKVTQYAYRALLGSMDNIGINNISGLTSQGVFDIRMSGEKVKVGDYNLPSITGIQDQVGYSRGAVGRLSPQQKASNLDSLQGYVDSAVKKYGNVPKDLLNSVITYESGGMINAVSGTGALGPMQITSQNYNAGDGFNPFDPEAAIDHGAGMLSSYIKKFGSDQEGINKTVAAYNQGLGAVDTAISTANKNNTTNWSQYIKPEGQKYIKGIQEVRAGGYNIPSYFGD